MLRIFRDKPLIAIVAGGFLVRILFLLYGAKFYYGFTQADIFTNGDTHSYILSFTNLWNYGYYTFDFLEPDAAFGRLPGYPLFYGMHYLIFGIQQAKFATACTQILLDTFSIILLSNAIRIIWSKSHWPPYVGAFLYAFYPFTIVWVTIVGTETLSVFMVLYWLNILLQNKKSKSHFLKLGLVIALTLFVREYLGILLPITLVYLFVVNFRENKYSQLNKVFSFQSLVIVGFMLLYIAWPIRNYYSFHRFVPLKPTMAGYANYNIDMQSFRDWVHCWDNNDQYWLEQVLSTDGLVKFPDNAFDSIEEKAEAQHLANLAKRCGSSFYLFRKGIYGKAEYFDIAAMKSNKEYQQNCNAEISEGFTKLKKNFMQQHPIRYLLQVPGANLYKALFKNSRIRDQHTNGGKQLLLVALFSYRTMVLIIGIIGFIVFWRKQDMLPALLVFCFMYFFITSITRSLEMRYLLHSDILALIPAAGLLGLWLDKRLPNTTRQNNLA